MLFVGILLEMTVGFFFESLIFEVNVGLEVINKEFFLFRNEDDGLERWDDRGLWLIRVLLLLLLVDEIESICFKCKFVGILFVDIDVFVLFMFEC